MPSGWALKKANWYWENISGRPHYKSDPRGGDIECNGLTPGTWGGVQLSPCPWCLEDRNALALLLDSVVAEERERCAKVAESILCVGINDGLLIARRIREGGGR
jgi:hypothetical protein